MSRSDQRDRQCWDGEGAPGGPPQGQSPARGAPDPAPRSGAGLIMPRVCSMSSLTGSDGRQH